MACFDKGWALSPHAHMVTPAPLPNFSRVNHLPTQHTKAPTVSIPCNFLFASSNPNWGSDSRTLCREEKIKMKQNTQSKHSSPNQHSEASPIWAVLNCWHLHSAGSPAWGRADCRYEQNSSVEYNSSDLLRALQPAPSMPGSLGYPTTTHWGLHLKGAAVRRGRQPGSMVTRRGAGLE